MANESNLLSTPEGYATPAQLQSTREYAKALLQGHLQQPVHHWTQGVSNMVSALMGGNMDYNAAQKEKAALTNQATLQQSNIPTDNFPVGGAASIPFSGSPSSAGQKNADALDSPSARAIAGIETGGEKDPYKALGPVINNPRSAYNGDQAHGKYQVMGKNIGPWTKEVFGKEMTPQEFDNNPQAQEAIFKAKFTNPRDWFGHGRSDGYMTGDAYVNRYNASMGKAGAPPAAQMAAGALRGETTQVAGDPQEAAARSAAPPSPKFNPAPAGEPPMVNPALVQKPPAYTRPNLIGTMGNPWTSPAEKQQAYEMALKQNQPIFMPSPTGSGQVLINPNAPGTQQYFAPAPHFGETAIGDLKKQVPTTFDRYGNPIQQTPTTVGPRSEAAPATAPTGGPSGAPPIVPVTAQNAPAGPTAAPEAVPNTGGVQVASNEPSAGAASAAVTPAKAAGPLAQFAQATPPGATEEQLKLHGFSDQDVQDYTAKKAYDQAKALEQEQGKSDIGVKAEATKDANKLSAKRYEDLQANANAAAEQRNNVAMARKMTEEPNFYAGLGNGLVETWKRFKAAAGIDPDAARPMEVFRKTTAQTIMSNLKTAFGGLGQIRVAEIRLQEMANASTSNTPSAIKALLEITDRNAAKTQQIGDMAAAYKNGEAIMDPKDPTKVLLKGNIGPDGEPMERIGLDSHWDKFLHQYVKANPTFSPEELTQFTEDLKGRKGEKDVVEPATGEAKSLETMKPGQTYQGHLWKGGDQDNPDNWETPAPKAK